MFDVLKLLAVFAAVVAMLRRKLQAGLAMLGGALLLALLYAMPASALLDAARTAFLGKTTIEFLGALMLIRVLEHVMRERELLSAMMSASRAYLRSRRAGIVAMPVLIGLLPSVGGAYFSAPMVAESTEGTSMGAEEKGFINFWFRHIWEPTLPLYPGLLLAAAISGLSLRSMIAANTGFAVVMLLTGFMFSMRDLGGLRLEGAAREPRELWSFLPLLGILVMVMAFNLTLYIAMAAAIAVLYVTLKMGPGDILRSLRAGFSWDLVALIWGVMLFKAVMEGSGAVRSMSESFVAAGTPLWAALAVLPFLTGLLTGFTIGFVGATFPLLVSLPGGGSLASVSFAFACGYIGVLISPVHICFVLTREYFKAGLGPSYRRMLVPLLFVTAYAAAQYAALRLLGH